MKFFKLAAAGAALSVFFTGPLAAFAQETPSYQDSMAAAGAAFQSEDWAALNEALDAAQSVRPYSLYVYRNRILGRMLEGRQDDAVALAADAARRGLTLNLTGHPAFEELTALPAFNAIAVQMEENAKPLGGSPKLREFAETELLPEAITYDRKKNLYIGSVRTGKILKASKKADDLTLVATAPGGVFDLEVRRDTVWAAVNNQLAYEGADPENNFAAIMAFSKKDGALLHDIRISEPDAILGDLEIAEDGTVYASDSGVPRLYRMAADGGALEVYAEHPRFVNLQGVALDEENNRLFVADYLAGVFKIDTRTGAVTGLANEADAHLGGIDGLYYYKGALIGIQNGSTPRRIIKLDLNDDATAIRAVSVMHRNLESWNEPTHGALLGKEFHYIATSNWPLYNDDWTVREGEELAPVRIITAPLESR